MDWLSFREGVDPQSMLDSLPLREFIVVWMHTFEGRSYAEIAPLIEVSKTTCHKLHVQAIERLRADASHVLGMGLGDQMVRVEAAAVVAEVACVLPVVEPAAELALHDVAVDAEHPLLPELPAAHDAVAVSIECAVPLHA